jgi:hypothetical protein
MTTRLLTALLLLLAVLIGCGPQAKPDPNKPPVGLPTIDDPTKALGDAAKDLTDKAQGAVEDATKKAAATQEAGVKIAEFFTQATTALSGVKDVETAKAAVPKLEALGVNADAIKGLLDKLPAEAKTAVTGAVDQGVASLTTLADQLKALPGVEPIIKPHLDSLLAKVAEWKGTAAAAPAPPM